MYEIFGVIDDRFRVSIVDSTMMWIVDHAMDKAHERVKSGEGVIERLHEISKFYELAVMQLDGCIKFVQQETENHNLESSHEEVLAGLTEIRNRLQRRLHESEMAIMQKDREFTERFESEFKLRQALEIKERELVSSQENLEIEKTRSAENLILRYRESEDDKVDREFDCHETGENKRNRCIDDKKVEEMGSDIDILKETLDITFGKVQNAIFFSEIGPMEQQIKSNIENGVISIFLKGFMTDFQEDLAAEARRKETQISIALNQCRSDIMNEVKSLCEDTSLASELDFGSKIEDDHFKADGNSEKYGIKNDEQEPEDEVRHYVAKMIKNHESIIRKKSAEAEELNRLRQELLREKTSLSSRRGRNSASLKSRIQEALKKLENSITPILGQNGDGNEEDTSPEERKQVLSEIERQKSDVGTLAGVWDKMHKQQDKETIEIHMPRQERDQIEFQNMMMEEIQVTLFKGLIEKFRDDLNCWELEKLISEELLRDFIKKLFNQQNETMESAKIEALIKDDVYHCLEGWTTENKLSQCSECKIRQEIYGIPFIVMLKTWQKNIEEYTTESLFREEIYGFVFVETIKSISCKTNHCADTKFFNHFLLDASITIKEDVLTEAEKEICNTVLTEAEKEVFNRHKKVNTKICNTGSENCLIQVPSLLPEGIGAEENLMPSSSSAIMEYNTYLKPTKLYSVQLTQIDSKCRELLEFTHVFDDFKLMAYKKLEAIVLRLEEMKHTLDPLARVHASLREKESLYKKAFISRCQNLRKAENEVDVLGDQVDIILSLLEKIYLILKHHSPVLQQYFDVSEILGLIKKEVAAVVYIPPEK